jgi:hypothetical protein
LMWCDDGGEDFLLGAQSLLEGGAPIAIKAVHGLSVPGLARTHTHFAAIDDGADHDAEPQPISTLDRFVAAQSSGAAAEPTSVLVLAL